MKNVIEVKDLSKKYGKFEALKKISFEVREGEILGLLGPNGSGKTTTINCILSLLNYNSGSIKIFDEEMAPDKYHIKEKIGVVFQDVAVFDELTVYENIEYFCGLYISDKSKRDKKIEKVINLVGLEKFKKFLPKQLSGGLLRRLNIACGIAHDPKLIFLDEPTVAVDPQSRNNILDGIRKLNKEGATIIYTSHYMEEVEQLCDRIIILDEGKIIASGTNDDLKDMISMTEKIELEVEDIKSEILNKISKMKGVSECIYQKGHLIVTYEKSNDNLINLVEMLKKNNVKYNKIHSTLPTLNDVFLELTGKELRD